LTNIYAAARLSLQPNPEMLLKKSAAHDFKKSKD
jgi:hypothetical protein